MIKFYCGEIPPDDNLRFRGGVLRSSFLFKVLIEMLCVFPTSFVMTTTVLSPCLKGIFVVYVSFLPDSPKVIFLA